MNTAQRIILQGFLLLPFVGSPAWGDWSEVSPDNPSIQYCGRIDFTHPLEPRFDWPGISITVEFQGCEIGFRLKDSKNFYDVQVDGKAVTVWESETGQEIYKVSNLPPGVHLLRVVKRTEALCGLAVFKGLLLPHGSTLISPPKKSNRRLEFLGDSFLCGYGDEATILKCPDPRPFENADRSFGPDVARALQAQYHMEAYSGKGIVRNWGYPKKRAPDPFGPLWERTLCTDPQSHWDFSQWVPDAVILHLGQNDFSSEPKAEAKDYIDGYVHLLTDIRGRYPHAFLFCFAPTGWPYYSPLVEEVVHQMSMGGDSRVYFVGYPEIPLTDLGCDYHPQVKAQQKLAEILIPILKKTMGWH